jgi:hypothetical protein
MREAGEFASKPAHSETPAQSNQEARLETLIGPIIIAATIIWPVTVIVGSATIVIRSVAVIIRPVGVTIVLLGSDRGHGSKRHSEESEPGSVTSTVVVAATPGRAEIRGIAGHCGGGDPF